MVLYNITEPTTCAITSAVISSANYISVSSLYLTHAWIEPYLFVSRKQKSPPGISSADSSCVLLRVYLFISVQVVRAVQTAQHI